MGFQHRKILQQEAEDMFLRYCKRNQIPWAMSGYEHLKQDSKFKDALSKLKNNKTAKRIRWFPDFNVVYKHASLVEIKNSMFIERDAYNVYMDLARINYNVALVILKNNDLFCCLNINNVIIKEQNQDRWKMPVIDNKWMDPRNWNFSWWTKYDYDNWIKEKQTRSGTAFGIIDFDNTDFLKLT